MPSRLLVNNAWIEVEALFTDAEKGVTIARFTDGTFRSLNGQLTTKRELLEIVPPPWREQAMAQAIEVPVPELPPPTPPKLGGRVCPTCAREFKTPFALMGHLRRHKKAARQVALAAAG